MIAELPRATQSPHREVNQAALEFIAFSGQCQIAHGIYQSLPEDLRSSITSKYILSEVVVGGIEKLRKFLSSSAESAARKEKEFIDGVVTQFVAACRSGTSRPRELFETLLRWSEELTRLSLLSEALHWFDESSALGVNRFPGLYAQTLLSKAKVLECIGDFPQAHQLLKSLAERPYTLADRNIVPELYLHLGRDSLQGSDATYYKDLLFRGLRRFYMNMEHRRLIVDQLHSTYRRSYRVALDGSVPVSDRIIYLVHRMHFILQGWRLIRAMQVTKLSRVAVLGSAYLLNRIHRRPASRLEQYKGKRNVLVTRAMGGIGDLLMMTPALDALKRKYRGEEIHLAIPRRYFPLFASNQSVHLMDIEGEIINHRAYRRWVNLTDCPAARVESRTAPRVRRNRIGIFARALGLGLFRTWSMNRLPRYQLTHTEVDFRDSFWKEHGLQGMKVIGVQLRSDEPYRDYPFMEEVIHTLAASGAHVIVFDGETITGYEERNIIKVCGLPMRSAFALASGCDAIVAPDSAFVHLAGALNIPCVGLYGPIDGKVRAKDYPRCIPLDARREFGCLPCWRNEHIPCKLTNMRSSVCMAHIPVVRVIAAVNEVLAGRSGHAHS